MSALQKHGLKTKLETSGIKELSIEEVESVVLKKSEFSPK